MGSVSISRCTLACVLAASVFAGCAHAPQKEPDLPRIGDADGDAGLKRDNASLRRRVQILEDRVLKLEHHVGGTSSEASATASADAPDVQRLPDGRELPVIRLGADDDGERDRAPASSQSSSKKSKSKRLDTQAQGGAVALDALEYEEYADDRLWSDPSGYDAESSDDGGSGKSFRLVGKELVRMTEPDRPKPADREPTGAKGRNLKSRYDAAIELYRAAAYAEAETAFEGIANDFPKSDYADNAWYWKGESAYDQDHFSDALAAFTAVVERYGGGNKAPDALLKIGLCYDKLGDQANARDVLTQLVSAYPGATASDIARARLAELGG